MALTALPEEILQLIVNQLSVKEILACSCVSKEWREKFNVDAFWKRFCVKKITNYLESNDCKVEPVFKLPEESESLQPLCSWRIHYMRNVHLLNNWRSERFSSVELRPYKGVISSDVKTDSDGIYWLFIRTEINIEIWNIHNAPQLYVTIPIFAYCPAIDILTVGKKVVISQWNILSVYSLETASDEALFRFVLEHEECLFDTFQDSIFTGRTGYINEHEECLFDIFPHYIFTDRTGYINMEDDFRFHIFGMLLVGYKRIPTPQTPPLMHIWDMENGSKIKVELMLYSLGDNQEFYFTNIFPIDDIYGLLRIVYKTADTESTSQLCVYDFKRLTYTKSNILVSGVVIWCSCSQNIIVTFSSHPGGSVQFIDYLSGKLLSVKEIGEFTTSAQMQLIDSYFMYSMFNWMYVMNIHTQEVIYCLEFSFHSFISRLSLIEPRFVVVWLQERGESPWCSSSNQEVWDVKDLSNKLLQCSTEFGSEMICTSNSKLLQCSTEFGSEMICTSNSIIKQVIGFNGMMCIYNFW